MIATFQEAVQYLYENLPMFQRIGADAFKRDLTNTIKLCEALDNPHLRFKSIHIAGTNGKGSTSHMLASILQQAGYKTGLYTSPHLKEFTERIKINGQEITQDFIIDFVNRMQGVVNSIQPSFFEITVAMAFDYFAKEKIDVAVVEVGLGGRLDSTNVITPSVSVITNIGWDHKDILGDTLEKIAHEKAGIIKSSVPVIVSEKQQEVEQVFIEKARESKSTLYFASNTYTVDTYSKQNSLYFNILKEGHPFISDLRLPLQGMYQKKNLTGVMKTVEVLNEHGFHLEKGTIVQGLEQVIVQTGLKGRWQKLSDNPLVICDTGHNIDGVREVIQQINQQKFEKLYMVWGSVKDKDVSEILQLLPQHAYYYFCQAKIPRALDAKALADKASHYGLKGEVVYDVNEAKKKALLQAGVNDFVFIGGSTFVVAELGEL